jgi:ABC-type glycerol-3-phosphate transport system substrate-binding protein
VNCTTRPVTAMRPATRRDAFAAGAALAVAGATVLGACAAPGGQPGGEAQSGVGTRDVTLRLWHWDAPLVDALTENGADLTQMYPRIKVQVEQTPKGEYVNKLIAQVSGGTPPDTIGVSVTGDFNVVQAKGMTVPLDDRLKRDRYDLGDFLDINLRQHRWQGKQIGLPYGWTMVIWFFNQDLFRQLGVKTPIEHWRTGTWTWATYLDLAQHFPRLGPDQFGTTPLAVTSNNGCMALPQVWSNGGEIFDAGYTRCLLDQGPALETYDFLYKATQYAPRGEAARTSTREVGKVAMWFDWELWYLLNLKTMQFTYSIVPPPAPAAGKPAVFIGNAPGFSVANGTANVEEAYTLLKHLVAPDSTQRYFLQANVSPLRKSQAGARDFWRSHPQLPDPALMAEIAEARNKSVRIIPRLSNYADFQAVLKEEFDSAWADQQSVRDAALKASQRATALLKEAEIDK